MPALFRGGEAFLQSAIAGHTMRTSSMPGKTKEHNSLMQLLQWNVSASGCGHKPCTNPASQPMAMAKTSTEPRKILGVKSRKNRDQIRKERKGKCGDLGKSLSHESEGEIQLKRNKKIK